MVSPSVFLSPLTMRASGSGMKSYLSAYSQPISWNLALNQPDSRCIYGRNDGGPNAWVCVPVLPLAGGVASAGGLPSLSLRFLLRGMGMVTQGAAGVRGDDCTVGYAGSVEAS